MKCTNCESTNIVYDVRAVDKTDYNEKQDLKVELEENPNAWIFKSPHEGTLKTNICVDCGYVMWFVSRGDARKLKEIQDKNK